MWKNTSTVYPASRFRAIFSPKTMKKEASPVNQLDVWLFTLLTLKWVHKPIIERYILLQDHMGMRSLGLSLQGQSGIHVFVFFTAAAMEFFLSAPATALSTVRFKNHRSFATLAYEFISNSSNFLSLLQTSLKRKNGRSTERQPVASSLYNTSLGIRQSDMREMWPSHCKDLCVII